MAHTLRVLAPPLETILKDPMRHRIRLPLQCKRRVDCLIHAGKCLMGGRGRTRTELWTRRLRTTCPTACPYKEQAQSRLEIRFPSIIAGDICHSIGRVSIHSPHGPTTDNLHLKAGLGITEAWKEFRMRDTRHKCKALAVNANSCPIPWLTCREVETWEELQGGKMLSGDGERWITDRPPLMQTWVFIWMPLEVQHSPDHSEGQLLAPSDMQTTSAPQHQETTTTGRCLQQISGEEVKGDIEMTADFPASEARCLMRTHRGLREPRNCQDTAVRLPLPSHPRGVAWAAAGEGQSLYWTSMVEEAGAAWKCEAATMVEAPAEIDGTTGVRPLRLGNDRQQREQRRMKLSSV
jgi:hypothetical protein